MFFLESALVGAAIVGVLAVFSPMHAASGLLAVLAARLTAKSALTPADLAASGLLELNGFFAGLSCATLLPSTSLGFAIVAGGLVPVAASALRRLLATWDLPLVVAPYMAAFWFVWLAVAATPLAPEAVAPAAETLPSDALGMLLASLRGVAQIVFVPRPEVGALLLVAISIVNARMAIAMAAAAIAATLVGAFAHLPAWQVATGLSAFGPVLAACAFSVRYRGLGRGSLLVACFAGPFLEAASIRVATAFGLHALSLSYVAFVWLALLVVPTRTTSASALRVVETH